MSISTQMTGPLCLCGCGEHLPYGSNRKYKRGHRARVLQRESAKLDAELGIGPDPVFDGYNFQNAEPIDTVPQSIPERFDAWDTPEWEINPDGGFTIADAAANAQKDPDTDIWATDNTGRQVPITKAVVRDVEAKLSFMLMMPGNMLSMVDPVCGGALVENTPKIAKSLTPILCQSKAVVDWFQKGSSFLLYVNFAMALWPLLATIWAHHFAAHDETAPNPMNGQMDINPNMYGVQ